MSDSTNVNGAPVLTSSATTSDNDAGADDGSYQVIGMRLLPKRVKDLITDKLVNHPTDKEERRPSTFPLGDIQFTLQRALALFNDDCTSPEINIDPALFTRFSEFMADQIAFCEPSRVGRTSGAIAINVLERCVAETFAVLPKANYKRLAMYVMSSYIQTKEGKAYPIDDRKIIAMVRDGLLKFPVNVPPAKTRDKGDKTVKVHSPDSQIMPAGPKTGEVINSPLGTPDVTDVTPTPEHTNGNGHTVTTDLIPPATATSNGKGNGNRKAGKVRQLAR